MNKRYALLLITLLLAVNSIQAAHVDRDDARRAAEKVFRSSLVSVSLDAYPHLYLFAPADGEGFVLMAADDASPALLAYSRTNGFPADEIPPHVAAWLDNYEQQVAACETLKLSGYEYGTKSLGSAVEPLLSTWWGQSPYYNAMCPYDSEDSAYSITGCVATAMAQVMKYWNHPATGTGSHSYFSNYGWLSVQFDSAHYQWDSMPGWLNYLSTEGEIAAVATLMFHAGVAVEMRYSPSASGAYVTSNGTLDYPSAENALRTYFGYDRSLRGVSKYNYTDAEWDSMMYVELDAGRPILYSGYDEGAGGHAFVLDGYDSAGLFHVNWGWRGSYNGFYLIDSLNPGVSDSTQAFYRFNRSCTAVIGIRPASDTGDFVPQPVTVACQVSDPDMGYIEGNGVYDSYRDTATLHARGREGYVFSGWASRSPNPHQLLVTTDYTDYAYFRSIGIDTLGYCDDNLYSSWRDDYGNPTEWAIRLPASVVGGRTLNAVQYVPYQDNNYDLLIYIGDSVAPTTLVYSDTSIRGLYDYAGWWQHYQLDSAIVVPTDSSLWISLRSEGWNFPAAMAPYSGNRDGFWYKDRGTWVSYNDDDWQIYYTWLLRGVFEHQEFYTVTTGAQWDTAICLYLTDSIPCTVAGGGTYLAGEPVTMAVYVDSSAYDVVFLSWSNGVTQNPYTFVPVSDTVVIAKLFNTCIGISDVQPRALTVAVQGCRITVSTNDALGTISLYDMAGRRLATYNTQLPTLMLNAPAAGIYLLQVAGMTPKKIVITK